MIDRFASPFHLLFLIQYLQREAKRLSHQASSLAGR